LFDPAVVVLPAVSVPGERDSVLLTPEEEGIVDELAAAVAVAVDSVEGKNETASGASGDSLTHLRALFFRQKIHFTWMQTL
jgi:hypothetical protein